MLRRFIDRAFEQRGISRSLVLQDFAAAAAILNPVRTTIGSALKTLINGGPEFVRNYRE